MGLRDVRFSCEQTSKATPEDLWRIISEWKRVPEFWKGTRDLEELNDGTFRVKFAFPGTGTMKIELDKPGLTVTEDYLKGPFRGEKTTTITNDDGISKLKTEWNVKLSPTLMFGRSSIEKHFKEGTENALKRISDASESSSN